MVPTGFSPLTDTAVDERVEERTVPTDEGDHERFSHYVDKHKLTEAMVMGTPGRGPVRQGLGAEPGAGEVPGLSGVQGDLGVVQARRRR